MMSASSYEVVFLYENANLSPEQIAEDLRCDVVSVKATLLQFSKVYRGIQKQEDTIDPDIQEMQDIVKDIARYSENDGVKLKAACRVIDEKKGRLDVAIKEIRSVNFNLISFNEQLLASRRAKEKIIELSEVKP